MLLKLLLNILGFMHSKIVQEYRHSLKLISLSKIDNIFNKLFSIDGEIKDLMVLHTFLFRYGKDKSFYWLLQSALRYTKWLSVWSVFNTSDSLCCEDCFIQIYDSVMITLKLSKLHLQVQPPLLIFCFLVRIDMLDPFDFLLSDLVLTIKVPKKSCIDTVITKVPMEHNTSLLQR